MAWLITRAPGYSFLAGLFYSLTSPTQLLVPDATFSWTSFWDARRLYLLAIWDDTPHVLALGFLPLAILFLSLSISKRRTAYYIAASICVAAGMLASPFGPAVVAMAAFCLLFVLQRQDSKRNILLTLGILACAYALAARFYPPSLLRSILTATTGSGEEGNWTVGSITALAITTLGWVLLWRGLQRWTSDWRLRFFALFAYLTSSPPILATFLHRHLLPQPNRYKFEMELAWALLVVFAARHWIEKMPRSVKAALLFLCLALAAEQVVSHRQYAKSIVRPGVLEKTIEYRAAGWAEQNLPGIRIFMPGSIAQWANAFTQIEQFSGASWSMAYNPVQQRGSDAALNAAGASEEDARLSLLWLKAYGVGAVCVSGPRSQEFWKPYRHPTKFEGILPVLWRSDDTAIYQIPRRTESLAHVVAESAVVRDAPRRPGDTAQIERYVTELDDPSLPAAQFRWEETNRIHIQTTAHPDQAISVQVSYQPGWNVTVGNRHPAVRADGLGLIWFRPGCNGPCDVYLDYNGGWELRFCRWVSLLALASLVIALVAHSRAIRALFTRP